MRAGACFGVHFGRWSDNGSQSERCHLLTYAPQQSAAHCSTSGAFEGGYRFATPLIGITPYAAVQVISLDLPAYAERSLVGGGPFALNYAGETTTDTRTELGLRTDKSLAMADGVLTLRGRLAWALQSRPRGECDLPVAAGHKLCRERRAAGSRFRARQRQRRAEVAERLLARRNIRRRVFRQRHQLRRQGRRQI